MGALDGKVAMVTGGSRGIGAAIVRTLTERGAAVVVGYRSGADAANAVVDDLRAGGARAIAVRADVTDPDAGRLLTQAAVDEFGGLDIAVSNAGIEHFGALETITAQNFDRVFRTNVAGQLFTAQAAAAVLPSGGRIVLMSSVSARVGVLHHSLYAASKAAVSALALNLAPELGPRGITVNAIAPGGTHTDMAAQHGPSYTHPALAGVPAENITQAMTAAGRYAEPAEIAAVVAFLASPDSSYVSGTTIAIDGGWM